jgi:hypothetical protein
VAQHLPERPVRRLKNSMNDDNADHGSLATARFSVPIAPVMVSQRTSEQVLGFPGRQYRETVQALGVPHVRRGKLVVARVADFVAAIEATAVKPVKVETNRERLRRVAGLGGGK